MYIAFKKRSQDFLIKYFLNFMDINWCKEWKVEEILVSFERTNNLANQGPRTWKIKSLFPGIDSYLVVILWCPHIAYVFNPLNFVFQFAIGTLMDDYLGKFSPFFIAIKIAG